MNHGQMTVKENCEQGSNIVEPKLRSWGVVGEREKKKTRLLESVERAPEMVDRTEKSKAKHWGGDKPLSGQGGWALYSSIKHQR